MKRVLLSLSVCALAVASLVLTGCGSTVSARSATTLNADLSGKRTLTFVVAKSDTSGENVNMGAIAGKLRVAKPSFATFENKSSGSFYKYVISYTFKDPADFEEKARWFGATANVSRQGAVLTPTFQLTETFKPEIWFQWALKATGRSSSDIKSVEYAVTMPGNVSELSGDGTASGAEFTKTDLSFSTEYPLTLLASIDTSVDSLSLVTVVKPDTTADRTLSLALPADTASILKKIYGGADGLKREFASWAGEGWAVDMASSTTTGTLVTMGRKASSLTALGAGEAAADTAPALDVLESSNAYVVRRRYMERFSPDSLVPGETYPATLEYRLELPWDIESFAPQGTLRQVKDRTLSWSGSDTGGFGVQANLLEVKTNVLYPMLGLLGILAVASLVALAVALARILMWRGGVASSPPEPEQATAE